MRGYRGTRGWQQTRPLRDRLAGAAWGRYTVRAMSPVLGRRESARPPVSSVGRSRPSFLTGHNTERSTSATKMVFDGAPFPERPPLDDACSSQRSSFLFKFLAPLPSPTLSPPVSPPSRRSVHCHIEKRRCPCTPAKRGPPISRVWA